MQRSECATDDGVEGVGLWVTGGNSGRMNEENDVLESAISRLCPSPESTRSGLET